MQARRLNGADAAQWRALRLEALVTAPKAFLTTYAEAEALPLQTIADRLEAGHTYGVARTADLVGIGSLIPMTRTQTRHRGEVGAFFVQAAAQGTGAAGVLMHAIIAAAADLGIWQLELFVADSTPRANAFYTRHSFVEAGRLPNAVVTEDGPETDILMVRTRR